MVEPFSAAQSSQHTELKLAQVLYRGVDYLGPCYPPVDWNSLLLPGTQYGT